jgi:hypothetical protein
MAQFTVYKNKNPQTRSAIPFLLDVQNDRYSQERAGALVTRLEYHRFEITAAIDFLGRGI